MISVPLPENERLLDLLAMQATEGLSRGENAELEALLRAHNHVDRDELMATAVLTQLALLGQDKAALHKAPLRVRAKLITDAARRFDMRSNPSLAEVTDRAHAETTRPWRWLGPQMAGWYAAAALLVAIIFYQPLLTSAPVSIQAPPAEQRAALLTQAGDVITASWSPSNQQELSGVTGDVVWSNAQQTGFLRLLGMPANDPRVQQYQLWIVDPTRHQHPVDGGVFDIESSRGEAIVRIEAKLPVSQPKVFAITREQPGGVVVSAGPLLVVAKVP